MQPDAAGLRVQAPAKINLGLRITGRRPDGYHALWTIFQKISMYDTLVFEPAAEHVLEVQTDTDAVAGGMDNLCHRAVRCLRSATGCTRGIKITIHKAIPAGAGLGGGSSDAAATLRTLNALFELGLSASQLHHIGLQLGADVPFFLHDQPTAQATGIGDILQPVKLQRRLWFLLICPSLHISTAWAYKTFSAQNVLTNVNKNCNLSVSTVDVSDVAQLLVNDFESVVYPRYPEIERIKTALLEVGAWGALLSGSGSSVYGLFTSRAACEEALADHSYLSGHAAHITHSL